MHLKLLFQLSWRNLWRHRRRNTILLIAIAIAVAGVVLLNSLLRGMQVDMENSVIENLTGHVKVLQPGYLDDPSVANGFEVTGRLGLGFATRGDRGMDFPGTRARSHHERTRDPGCPTRRHRSGT